MAGRLNSRGRQSRVVGMLRSGDRNECVYLNSNLEDTQLYRNSVVIDRLCMSCSLPSVVTAFNDDLMYSEIHPWVLLPLRECVIVIFIPHSAIKLTAVGLLLF